MKGCPARSAAFEWGSLAEASRGKLETDSRHWLLVCFA